MTDADNGKIFTGCDGYGSVTDDASGVFDTFALYKSLGGEVFGTENEADFLSLDVADVKKATAIRRVKLSRFSPRTKA